jgi:hypothetical protein
VSEVGRINGNLNLSRSLGDLKYKQSKALSRAEQVSLRDRQHITHEKNILSFR